MSTHNRPLSPHLQVYRLPLIAVLSISHRASGIVLAGGAVVLAAWLLALAAGADAFATATGIIGSLPGKVLLVAFTFALYFHLCNGIRHLFWDAGHGFELSTADASGKAALACAAVLTVLTWVVALASGGGS